MRKFLSVLLALAMVLGLMVPVMAAEGEKSDDIVILYTNDVHTYIDGSLSYDVIAALKDDLQEKYHHVLLVDAGDHIQGTAYGSMDKGKTIIDLMNAADYDLATLGNHEFDYGMAGRINVTDVWAEYPYVSCNFYHEEDGVRGDSVLPAYEIFTCGETDVAFVGITTPSTFTSSTPAYFQDEAGNYIYGISGGRDGSALYEDVQTAIDDAVGDGAEIVLALGHLGVEMEGDPWSSEATIANVSGLDAFIDGHSHTIMEGELVSDKDGEDVLLTQTGEYFGRIGIMVIDAETGAIETDFIEYDEVTAGISSELYTGTELLSDSAVQEMKQGWMDDVNGLLGEKIGTAEVTLDNYDVDGNRLVRSQETNSGDFSADALYYLFDEMNMDVDLAVMNGGGVRNGVITGDLSYLSCKEIHTFGNVACLLTVTGQQVLDALEWGARSVGEAEEGSFLHVSGLTYKIDVSTPNTTKQDDKGVWTGGPEKYRVHDVKVYNKETDSWDDLKLDESYNMAGYNYTLRDLGGGFAMLEGAVNVLDYVMEDYMVLAEYVKGFEDATVKADNSPLLQKYPGFLLDYSDVSGSGRICFDADGDHICDVCWTPFSECVDEEHDHICDICGEMPIFTDEDASDGWSCDVCGKAALNLKPQYMALSYRVDEDENVYASGVLKIGTEVLSGSEVPQGTVTATWGEYAFSGALEDGGLELAFEDVPQSDLDFCDIIFTPEEGSGFMPGSGGRALDDDAPFVSVTTEYECMINGIPTDYLRLLPGTPVEVSVTGDGEKHAFIGVESDMEPDEAAVEDNVVSLTMPEENLYVNVSECICAGFEDVDTDAWYHPYVYYALNSGLMVGTGKDTFAPEGTTSRAMLVTMLWRLEGKPETGTTGTFTDVRAGAYYEKAVEWAAEEGIVLGVGGGRFKPDDPVTREEAAVILWRYAKYRGADVSAAMDLTVYPDGGAVSTWAKTAMEWAVGNGIIIGDRMNGQNYLCPDAESSRAVIATLIGRFIQNRGAVM